MRLCLTILVASLYLVVSGVTIISLTVQENAAKPTVEVFKSPT